MKTLQATLIFLIGITNLSRSLRTNDPIQERKKALLKKLIDDHDSRVTPSMANVSGGGGDVEVEISFAIQDISISDYDMEFGVQAVVQQEWVDDRLKYDSNSVAVDALTLVGQDAVSAFWTPDIHFVNDQGEQQKLNSFLKIQPSGHVLYSYSVSLTLPCYMFLQKFPFDSQICSVEIGCRGFANDDVKFIWSKKVEKSHQLEVKDGFVIVDILSSSCFSESLRDSRLRVAVVLRRALVFYALRVFLPSIALVLVAWFSSVPLVRLLAAILGLGLVACVTSELDAAMPRLDHLTAADLWTSACSLLLLASILDVFHARGPLPLQNSGVLDTGTSVRMKQLLTPGEPAQELLSVTRLDRLARALPGGSGRHSYARLLLPPLFIVFSFLYFTIYLLIRE